LQATGIGPPEQVSPPLVETINVRQNSRLHRSRAVHARSPRCRKPDAVVEWTRAKSGFLETGLIEDGRPVRLQAVIFKPNGAGPFPLAVVNHGSTGPDLDSPANAEAR
jgi:hypothetical protein